MYAPVVLFVYARLDHTQKTIEALKENYFSEETDLIIYSDAPKNESDKVYVEQVRSYLITITGFKSVNIVKRNENYGLAKNIIEGVTHVINDYGQVIVLEDDIVTSPYFLQYMNDALTLYENHDDIISVSGYRYPVGNLFLDSDIFFLRIPMCWGWATWKDKWNIFHKDLEEVRKIDKKQINFINFDGTMDFFIQAKKNISGKLNTWFIFWYIASVKRKMLTIFPIQTLVINIGHDGTGNNCGENTVYDDIIRLSPVKVVNNLEVVENINIINSHKKYFRKINPYLFKRIIRKIIKI